MLFKFFSALAVLILTQNSFAIADYTKTDEQLEELGMSPVANSSEIKKSFQMFAPQLKSNIKTLDVDPVDYRDLAKVFIVVDKAEKGTSNTAQTMTIYIDGEKVHTFPVSTGKEKKVKSTSGKTYISSTPVGFFRPTKIYKEYYSYTWGGAAMPNAVFFQGGTALHATTPEHFATIGKRDSGGCVRLMPKDAEIMNEIVLSSGLPIWKTKDEPVEIQIKTWKFTTKTFTVVRKKVINATMDLPDVDLLTGDLLDQPVNSVDTIIAITDRSIK